jgi:rhamnulokinase
VRCGPVEATALGNGAVQLAALGELGGLEDIRRVVAASGDLVSYEPATASTGHDWEAAAALVSRLRRQDQAESGLLTQTSAEGREETART